MSTEAIGVAVKVPSSGDAWRRIPKIGVLRLLAVAGGAVLVTRMFGEYGNSVVIGACISIIVVTGLHVLVQWGGQVSLGQAVFVAVGAFVTARANASFGVPLPLSVLAGIAAAVVASAIVGIPALRVRGFTLAIVTFALGYAAQNWLFLQSWLLPSSTGLPLRATSLIGFSIENSSQLVVPVVVITAVVVAITVRIGRSSLGQSMRVVAFDEEVAASYGLSVSGHKLAAFLFAGACAGLAGALTVISIGEAGATVFPVSLSITYISAVLLGGRGPVWGSVVAGGGLGAIPILLSGLGNWIDLIGPLAIILVVRTFPGGLNEQVLMASTAVRKFSRRLRSDVDGSKIE